MKFAAAFALLATAVISTVSAQTGSYTNFTNCGIDLDYPAQYATSAVALSPSPLCIGKQFCMTATGVLSAPITQGATYSIVGRWLGRVIYTDSQDVCALLAANGQACPIPAGPYNMNLCHTVKPNLPQSMEMQVVFQATNGNGNLLFCQATPEYKNPRAPAGTGLVGVNCP